VLRTEHSSTLTVRPEDRSERCETPGTGDGDLSDGHVRGTCPSPAGPAGQPGRAFILGGVTAREEIRVAGQAEPISHYTDAVRVGDLLFVSGCVPVDAHGQLVGGDDVVAQARQTFANVGAVLAAGGSSFADVVKVMVFLTDVDDRSAINPVRREVFGDSRPASTLVEVTRLAIPGAKIEVEAVAVVRA